MQHKISQGRDRSFTDKHFIFGDQIGVGQSGIVYKGVEKISEKQVAIKIIPKKKITSSELHKQLQREIQIHSRLKHENIVQLYAYFADANSIYLVLEYCPHKNLAQLIKIEKAHLHQKKIASICQQILKAISYLQQRFVMHRDIKLENILLDHNFNAKIADFGWCIHVKSQRNTFCGTMEYICPEMINQQSYGHQIDVYCFGICLYEMFFIKSPFIGTDQDKTLFNIQSGIITFDNEIRQISDDAKDLILLMLNKDRLKRPKAKDLLNHPFLTKNLSNLNRNPHNQISTNQTKCDDHSQVNV